MKTSRWVVVVPRVMGDSIISVSINTTVKDGSNAFAQARAGYKTRWLCLWDGRRYSNWVNQEVAELRLRHTFEKLRER